ncbi:MAG: nitroreductase [Cyclobacteriaceae bacterium]|jgi:nitroreductase|nr:nitroreductase [Cyclobacteriaceae bacterium]
MTGSFFYLSSSYFRVMNADELSNLIQKRRSVFQAEYSDERVDDAVIERMLENANWAPTHKMTEPWRFVVFTGEGLKALAKIQSDFYKSYTTADGTFREDRYRNLQEKPLLSSHIIAVIMKRDPAESVPAIEEAGAVFCAVQNMYLTAAAYGVGCYFSTGGITYFDGAAARFGFSEQDVLLGFLHVGTPKTAPRQGKRRPVSEKTRWVTAFDT